INVPDLNLLEHYATDRSVGLATPAPFPTTGQVATLDWSWVTARTKASGRCREVKWQPPCRLCGVCGFESRRQHAVPRTANTPVQLVVGGGSRWRVLARRSRPCGYSQAAKASVSKTEIAGSSPATHARIRPGGAVHALARASYYDWYRANGAQGWTSGATINKSLVAALSFPRCPPCGCRGYTETKHPGATGDGRRVTKAVDPPAPQRGVGVSGGAGPS